MKIFWSDRTGIWSVDGEYRLGMIWVVLVEEEIVVFIYIVIVQKRMASIIIT